MHLCLHPFLHQLVSSGGNQTTKGATTVLQVCDLQTIKLVLCAQPCPALLRLIEEEQMVFVSCQHQSPLPPTLKWICGASQDPKKKKKMSEWREETEAEEEREGQAGWGLGGTVLLSLNAVQW